MVIHQYHMSTIILYRLMWLFSASYGCVYMCTSLQTCRELGTGGQSQLTRLAFIAETSQLIILYIAMLHTHHMMPISVYTSSLYVPTPTNTYPETITVWLHQMACTLHVHLWSMEYAIVLLTQISLQLSLPSPPVSALL